MSGVPRKILMLHGYSQNAIIFSKRLGALRKSLGKEIELVFVDGQTVLHPIDLVGLSFPTTSLDALGAPEASAADSDPSLTPRAWWRSNPERTVAHGLDESLLMLKEVLKRDRFDGVFGFSQGAAMAALLAALLERPHLYPPFLVDGQPLHPPFQFCVSVSGFRAPGALSAEVFSSPFSTPTVHVIGRTDFIVTEERSKVLLELSTNARKEEHGGGHFVPSKANWRNFFRDYFHNPGGSVASPGTSSVTIDY
ncbi:hypothetical protein SERLA73DRAFT_178698 [Serpula lacrymans var. lacrymans S7.3]|uniref:Serine hydrolase domain-containing protein n=1 Tax=Serpula lacrymans var. lacrymans (strain S7.3) TaxID=936435 RepID=F8PSL0_SERL3|nr:hypothetical protein SERLA73DRAFT_178698 [Serpula lacrymans var. lacrymans S7.3]